MRIGRLGIRNLRGIGDTTLELHDQLTVLVGANNAGKTTVLDALAAVLSHGPGQTHFRESDLRLEKSGQDARAAPPIQIELEIVPSSGTRFEPGELGELPDVGQDGSESVRLRLTAAYDQDPTVRAVRSRLERIDPAEQTIGEYSSFPFRAMLPLRRFGTERQFERGKSGRTSDWARLIGEVEPDAEIMREAIRRMRAGSEHFVENTASLSSLHGELGPAASRVGLDPGAGLRFSAAPVDPHDLLSGLTLELELPGCHRPFHPEKHGLGTQGALLFALYDLYVQRVLRAAEGSVTPILAVEEPEAHQHPTAQRSMARCLRDLPGQVIATTHAPEIVRQLDARHVAVLRAGVGGTACCQSIADERRLSEHASVLFSRGVILAEGYGEVQILPALASALGHDLNALGIEIVNADGQGSITPLWKCFGPPGFDFPCICVADADQVKPLMTFVRAACTHASRTPPASGDTGAIQQELARHHYHTPAWQQSLDSALATTCPAVVDDAFIRLGEPDFATWRQATQNQGVRGGGTVGALSDVEARAWRLSQNKYQAPAAIADMLDTGVCPPAALPSYLTDAIQDVIGLAS